MPTLNVPLKMAILESPYGNQRDVARMARMDSSRLSQIVRGHVEPNESEKLRLAGVLQRPVQELFPEVAA